jgi:hypothetical protein
MSLVRFALLTAVALTACTTHSLDVGSSTSDAGETAPIPVGAPCIPSPELSSSFLGFSEQEVILDRGNAACGAGVCLANHFRGRVSCPYGQNENATAAEMLPPGHLRCGAGAPSPTGPCCAPGTDVPVLASADASTSTSGSEVLAQCSDRTASRVVTCSCRCANAQGKTDDGAEYCACPSGTTCGQVVPEFVAGDPLAGGYCVPDNTAYDVATSCSVTCNGQAPGDGGCSAPSVETLPGAQASASSYFATVTKPSPGLDGGIPTENCVWPVPLAPPDADGEIGCQVYLVLTAGDSCAQHPGLTPADPVLEAALGWTSGPITACQLPQLPPPCASSAEAGWCYALGPATQAATGCAQAVQMSPAIPFPTGATLAFVCP